MPATTTSERTWIQLDMTGADGVTINPGDGDLYSLSRQMVVRAGKIAYDLVAIESQLAQLREILQSWVREHRDHVNKAILALKREGLQFLVVQKCVEYDDELESALTDLDMRIAQNRDLDRIKLSVLALPEFSEEVIQSFLPPAGAPDRPHAERDEPLGAGQS